MRKAFLFLIQVLFFIEVSIAQQSVQIFQDSKDISRYFLKNLKYNEDAIDSCISGYVLFSFNVSKKGNISKINTLYSDHDYLKQEVLRVLYKSDGAWARISLGMDSGTVLLPVIFGFDDADICCRIKKDIKQKPVPEVFLDELSFRNCYVVPRVKCIALCMQRNGIN